MQWCLLEVREARDELGVDRHKYESAGALARLEWVTQAFDLVLRREAGRGKCDEESANLLRADGLNKSAMPVMWSFFNCYENFISDIAGNRGPGSRGERAGKLAAQWRDLAKRSLQVFEENTLRPPVADWVRIVQGG